ncbi:hypothetical protein BCR36DRAFT_277153, partial [Piromyces finnis]
KCGKDIATCGTSCCSKYGYCGITEAYCGTGCQIGFGSCRCGLVNKNGKTVNFGKCPSGYCCSTKGYCGKTKSYCNAGYCQSSYGICN